MAIQMLAFLDRKTSFAGLVWAFPIVFLAHDGEELVTREQFLREHRNLFPEYLLSFAQMPTAQFALCVAFLLVLGRGVAYLALRPKPSRFALQLYEYGLAIRFTNAVMHLGQTVILGEYVPGVATAAMLGLPYSLYAFHRLLQSSWLTRMQLLQAVLVGALVQVPIVLVVILIGKLIGTLLGT
jgi:hypothetical protein